MEGQETDEVLARFGQNRRVVCVSIDSSLQMELPQAGDSDQPVFLSLYRGAES